MTAARGLRNNNPGNIRKGENWQGLAAQQLDPEFCTFETMAWGIRALVVLLRTYRFKYGLTTVKGIVNRWAPPTENDTGAYVNAVCDGWVRPDEELPDTRDAYLFLAQRIAKHENGPNWTSITPEQWAAGMELAGFSSPSSPAPASPPAPTPEEQTRVIIEPAPAPAPKERKVAPFIPIAFEFLTSIVPSLIRRFGTEGSKNTERNAQLAETVVQIAQQAVGATNAQDVVERLTGDPGLVSAVEAAVQANWFRLEEAGGGGIEGARKSNVEAANVPLKRNPAFMVAVLILPMIYFAVVWTLIDKASTAEIKTMVVSLVVGGALGSILGFFLGSSFTTSTTRGIGVKAPDGK